MTKARDISKLLSTANGKIAGANLDVSFENISDTGTQGTKVASGTTGQRGSTAGQLRFNTTTGLAEYYTGSEFKVIDSPPTITAVSPLEVDSAAGGNITFTITGSNFGSGAVTKFIGNDATEITALTTTINSGSSISAVIARSSFVSAKEPYDVRVINASGLAGTLDNQINVDTSPTWTTASGSLGAVTELTSASFSATATDADSDTIVYSLLSGSLPSGLSLNTSTGAITGTAPDLASTTTYSFTLRATANSQTADRAFSITVNVPQTYTFSYTGADQTLTVPAGVTSISVDLRGAGGGNQGNAGAGGTGGKTVGTLAVTAGQVYKIVVGQAGKLTTGSSYGGGGSYTAGSGNGGGGGGYTGIFLTSVSQANAKAIAGGGGGAAYGGNQGGSGGGTTGGSSSGGDITVTGGSQSAGGSASGSRVGSALQGGNAGGNGNGGSGGGGYYGGGGGAEASNDYGGGGGSGYIGGLTSATTTNAQGSSNNANGVAYLTY